MRHVVIYKRTANLERLDLSEQPVASFYVGDHGIERVDFGDEEIPNDVAVFDPSSQNGVDRVTLETNPVLWADLLGTAYRTGDYRVAVVKVDSAEAGDDLTSRGGITAELEALPQ